MSGFENQSFDSKENLNIGNEQLSETNNFQEMLDFFEYNFIDTELFQKSYESFSNEQRDFIENSFAILKESSSDSIIIFFENNSLPYDEGSFLVYFKQINNLLNDLGLKSLQLEGNNKDLKGVDEINDKLNEVENNDVINFYNEYSKIYNNYTDFFNENGLNESSSLEEIKDFFNQPENIQKLFELAKEKGGESVKELHTYLTELNQLEGFDIQGLQPLDTYIESSEVPKIPSGGEIIQHGLDTSDVHITETQGSALIYGDQKIDFGEKPPVKYITNGDFELKSGELDYKVDKQLRSDIFVLEHKIPKLENQISNLESNMSKLDSFSQNLSQMDSFNEQTLDYLYGQFLREHGNPLRNDILGTINTQGEINMDRLKSLLLEDNENKKQELLININDKKELLQEQKTQLQLMKQKLSDMQNAFKEQVLEKDEKVRKILEFVGQIGLDLIQPQSRLDQIFRELKDNSLKISGLNLDPQKIDLANGRFGESDMEQSTDKWKINLIKFFNKMISGDTNQPHDVQQFVSVGGKTINPTEFKQTLEDAGVINDMGEAQITKIRQNLTSVGNVSTEESEKNKEK